MTTLKKPEKKPIFTDSMYYRVIDEVEKCLVLTLKEKRNLYSNPVPRFVAEIPTLAGQQTPEVKSAMNLISYITGSRNKDFFAQRTGQTIRERIDTYIHGSDGDQQIMALCRDILEEVSLFDHKNDIKKDEEEGYFNPLSAGEICFLQEKKRLERRRLSFSPVVRSLVEGRFEGQVLSIFWLES